MTDYSYENVLVEIEDEIAWVTLNRPEKRNAMSPALCYDMVDVLTRLANDPGVRVLVLTGAGEAFSAGMDLKLFFRDLDGNPAEKTRAREADRSWNWQKLSNFPKPTIAMVNGYCFGGAFTPLVACDIAIAGQSTRFTLAYTAAGLSPDGSSTWFLPRLIGLRRARELMLTNRMIGADEAREIGVIDRVVPDDDLMDEAMAQAKAFAAGPTKAYGATKRLLQDTWTSGLETQMDRETRSISDLTRTADARQGIDAFLNKRKPSFRGE